MADLLYWIFFGLSKMIYSAIPALYDAFSFFAKNEFFDIDTDIREIWGHLYVLLSVLVLFAIAIKLINAIVNPDVLTDSKKGVKKAYFSAIIAVFLTILTPYIFTLLVHVEKDIIDNHIIEKQLFGYNESVDGGKIIAWTAITSFIDLNKLSEETDYVLPSDTIQSNNNHIYAFNKDIDEGFEEINNVQPWKYSETVDQHPILMAISGFIIVYELVLLVMDTALRSIKLGLLQIMTPIILGAYIFKSDILKNWIKEYIKTYLQIFLLLIAISLLTQILRLLPNILVGSTFDSNWLVVGIINMLAIFACLRLVKQIVPLINTIFGTKIQGKGGIKGRLGDMAAVGGLAQSAWGALGNTARGVGKGTLNVGKTALKAPGAALGFAGKKLNDKLFDGKLGTSTMANRAKALRNFASTAAKTGDFSKAAGAYNDQLKSPSYLSAISAKALADRKGKGDKQSGVDEHGVYTNIKDGEFKTNADHNNDANIILDAAKNNFKDSTGKQLVESMGKRFTADQKANLLNGIKSTRDKLSTQLSSLHSSMASSGLYDDNTLANIDRIAKKFDETGKISGTDADTLTKYMSTSGAKLLASTYGKLQKGISDAKSSFDVNDDLNGAVSLGNVISAANKDAAGYKADEESLIAKMTEAEKAQYKIFSEGLTEISQTTAGASQNDKNISLSAEDSWASNPENYSSKAQGAPTSNRTPVEQKYDSLSSDDKSFFDEVISEGLTPSDPEFAQMLGGRSVNVDKIQDYYSSYLYENLTPDEKAFISDVQSEGLTPSDPEFSQMLSGRSVNGQKIRDYYKWSSKKN